MTFKWIDILKGFGIVFVVLGHMTQKNTVLTNFIFLFHIPLFFFISGYLFKKNPDEKIYLRKKTISLLVPYLSFFILVLFIPLGWHAIHDKKYYEFGITILKALFIGGRDIKGTAAVFWFITVLFFTQQLVNYLLLRVSRLQMLLISSMMLGISYINNFYFQSYWLPFNSNVIFAALPIFYAGYLFKSVENNKLLAIASLVVSIASLITIEYGINNTYDMKLGMYGIPLISFICAISLVILLIHFSKIIQYNQLSQIFSHLGRASLVIMFVHITVLLKVRTLLGEYNEITTLFLTVLISYMIYWLITKHSISRALLLGAEKDFETLKSSLRPHSPLKS